MFQFSFLNNYFENNAPEYFTLSMWFKQTQDGFDNIFNLPEGLFANGNCNEVSLLCQLYVYSYMKNPFACLYESKGSYIEKPSVNVHLCKYGFDV